MVLERKVQSNQFVARKTYRNAGQTRTLTHVVVVVTGRAIATRRGNWISTITVLTFHAVLAPVTVPSSTTPFAFRTARIGQKTQWTRWTHG